MKARRALSTVDGPWPKMQRLFRFAFLLLSLICFLSGDRKHWVVLVIAWTTRYNKTSRYILIMPADASAMTRIYIAHTRTSVIRGWAAEMDRGMLSSSRPPQEFR